jgi:hypothetical protein
MVPCAYCERPLICDGCGAEYTPPSREDYEDLSRPEVAVICPECEAPLVCHWCKTPFDGGAEGDSDAPRAGELLT